MGIFDTLGAQSIPADRIEIVPTPTDLIETRDAADTNDGRAVSLANIFANVHAVTGLVSATKTTGTLAEADSGKVLLVDTDAQTITLPATVVGMTFTLVNGGVDGAVNLKIAPNASDKIMGNGYTSADNKFVQNTKATAKKGDFLVLVGDGVNGWFVQEVRGTWAKEA